MASQINPNNIDGTYPIAGQDNNSQGFRDNFTNTRLNFQYAEDEINDLQNKVLLKAPLTGQALDNNMNDNLLLAARIQDFSATRAAVVLTSGAYNFNYAAGHYQTISTATPTSVLAFSNFPPEGLYGYFKIQVQVTSVSHVLQIPAAVSLGLEGIQGISPGIPGVTNTISFSQTGFYEFGFGSYDNGATITIFDLNRALTNFSGGDLAVQNLFASATVSAVGNVRGGNITTGGRIDSDGTITGGNLATGGSIAAGGNIIAANFSSIGDVNGRIVGKLRPAAASSAIADTEPLKFTAGIALLATPEAGAFEYDGTVFYASPTDDQRGLLPSTFLRVLTADYPILSTDLAQNVFPVPSSVNLEANTSYEFEGQYIITRSSGIFSHTVATTFALGGTLNNIMYMASATTNTSNALTPVSRIYGTSISPVTVTATSSNANEVITIQLRGILRADTAGSFTPQIKYSDIPGGPPTVLQNSFFRIVPVGSASFASVGEWT
jgi:hypothetical protein